MLQPALISLNFVRPVTPKVAGLSLVAPAISIDDLARASCSDCNFLAPQSCNFFALDGGALAATGALRWIDAIGESPGLSPTIHAVIVLDAERSPA